MKYSANQLEFISRINRDGSGTQPVTQRHIDVMKGFKDKFKLVRLSLSEDTYIAHGFNSFVVRLKQKP